MLLSICPRGYGRVINPNDGLIIVCEPCAQGESSNAYEPNVCLVCDQYGDTLRPTNGNFHYISTSSCHDLRPEDCVCEFKCLAGYYDEYQCRSAFDLAYELLGEYISFVVYAALFLVYAFYAVKRYRLIFRLYMKRQHQQKRAAEKKNEAVAPAGAGVAAAGGINDGGMAGHSNGNININSQSGPGRNAYASYSSGGSYMDDSFSSGGGTGHGSRRRRRDGFMGSLYHTVADGLAATMVHPPLLPLFLLRSSYHCCVVAVAVVFLVVCGG